MRTLVFVALRAEGRECVEKYQAEGRDVVYLTSSSDNDERVRAIEWFRFPLNKDRVLICHWQMMAHGWRIDTDAVVLFSPTFPNDPLNPAPMLQCLARATRPLREDGTLITAEDMRP